MSGKTARLVSPIGIAKFHSDAKNLQSNPHKSSPGAVSAGNRPAANQTVPNVQAPPAVNQSLQQNQAPTATTAGEASEESLSISSLPVVHTYNQEVCIDTELVVVPKAECSIRNIRRLESGIGIVSGAPSTECSNRVFQVFQVDLDVAFSADAFTRNGQIVSNPLMEGPSSKIAN